MREGASLELRLKGLGTRFTFCQPLPDGRWLLVGTRCDSFPDGTHEENGLLVDAAGNPERTLLLGDGIQEVQTTADGRIWTSYFDEGVFGNRGWKEPVGAAGLICWSDDGEKLYEFAPSGPGSDLDHIVDCYALNVTSNRDAWICYYTDFPLVRITDHEIAGVWKQPVGATHAFAVWKDLLLFQRGDEDAHRFSLCTFASGDRITVEDTFVFQDAHGNDLPRVGCAGRGPFLFLFAAEHVYRVDVRELAQR